MTVSLAFKLSNDLHLEIELRLGGGEQLGDLALLLLRLLHLLLTALQVSVQVLQLELEVCLGPLHFLELLFELGDLGLLGSPL